MIIRLCSLAIFPLLAGCGSMTAIPSQFGEGLNLGYPEFPLPPSAVSAGVIQATLPPPVVLPEQPSSSTPRQTYEPSALSSHPDPFPYDPAKDPYLTSARVGDMPADNTGEYYRTGADGNLILPPSPNPRIIQVSNISEALAKSAGLSDCVTTKLQSRSLGAGGGFLT